MTSFDFTWNDTSNQPTGKVFARKRKLTNKTKTVKEPPEQKGSPSRTSPKKAKQPSTTNITKVPIENNTEKTTVDKSFPKHKQKTNYSAHTFDHGNRNPKNSFSEESFEPPHLVKRKQKKDKIAARNQETPLVHDGSKSAKEHSLFSEKYKQLHINSNIKGASVVEKVFSAGDKKFSDLEIHKYIVSNLEKHKFSKLTNVQEKAIPVVLSGRNALIRSQTGSGKTLSYAIPILNSLQNLNPRLQRSDGIQAIIVVPTRELALQTHELFGKINTFQWIVVGHLCGGENRKTEKDRLRKGVHILIATPGRLLDHILHTTAFKSNNVHYLVLDEADRLLDMGFKRDIEKIVEELDKSKTNSSYDPLALLKGETKTEVDNTDRQTILLSATLTKGIAELAEFTMKDHVYIDALSNEKGIETNPNHMVIPSTVKQEFLITFVKHRLFTLSALLIAKCKQKSKIFVFMATNQMVDYHYELFTKCLVRMPKNRGKLKMGDVVLLSDDEEDEEEIVVDIEFFKLHGSMDQSARKDVFARFKASKRGVLLCTDVAARGLDVPEADCIVQYTGPQSDDDYLHRVGRTGRAGKSGAALIFLTHEEQDFVTRLQGHKVFLKEHKPDDFLKHLSDLMEEPDQDTAAAALQKHYENCLNRDKDLQKKACFAYSSWSRFYNTYPSSLRSIFDFKKLNLGHYVTSFGLRETPTSVSRIVRGQVVKVAPQRLNKKLATHENPNQKRKIRSVCLSTSEFSSGLEPSKKKKKKNK